MPEPLGRIRASSRPISAPQPRIDPGAFGGGIAEAIRGLGRNMQEFELSQETVADSEQQLTRAHTARENRIVRARTRVAIAEAQATLAQQTEELRRQMPVDGSGFTNQVHELVTAQVASIAANIPEALRPEFDAQLAEMVSSFSVQAYSEELSAGDAAYQGSFSSMMEQAQNAIVLSEGDPTVIEEWRGQIEGLLQDSPLDQAATEVLRSQANATFDVLAYSAEVENLLEAGPGAGGGALPGGTDGRDVAATNLPGPVRGMLNAGGGPIRGMHPEVAIDVQAHTGRPAQQLLNILSHTAYQVFGAGTRIVISSGHEGRATGTPRHPAGNAADFDVILPDGSVLGYMDPREENIVRQFMFQAAANGITGMGYGRDYMGGRFHMDIHPGVAPVWADGGSITHLMPDLAEALQAQRPALYVDQGDPAGNILGLVRRVEASGSYDTILGSSPVQPPRPVSQMTLNEVRAFQNQMTAAGAESGAVGAYQFIGGTLQATMDEMGLTGDEVFSPQLQDRMAQHLLRKRGYDDWVAGRISDDEFADNLAAEWAALPLANGDSRYEGVGSNTARATRQELLAALGSGPRGGSYSNTVTYGSGGDISSIAGTREEGRFEDFAAHPGTAAAGRYSMTEEAWEEARTALGLADFSPASQDRAAWWLAARTYREETGRDLNADLASGDPTKIEMVRRTLVEASAGFALPNISEMSSDEFFAQVTLSDATLPGVMFEDRFQNIPVEDRMTIYQDAQQGRNERIIQAQQQADEARSSFLDQLAASIQLGQAGAAEIQAANEQYNLLPTEMLELTKAFQSAQSENLARGQFANAMVGGNYVDMSVAENRRQYNEWAAERHIPAIGEQDENAVRSRVIPDIVRTGIVAEPVRQQLEQMVRSADRTEQDFAFQVLAAIRDGDGNAFNSAFGSQMAATLRYATGVGSLVSQEERVARINDMLSPFGEEVEQRADAGMSSVRSNNPEWFQPERIARTVLGRRAGELMPGQATEMTRQFTGFLREGFRVGLDPNSARDHANEELGRIWGTSEAGDEGGYVVPYRIEDHYPASPTQGHRWLADQARLELSLPEGESIRFVPTPQTIDDIKQGNLPAYGVLRWDETVQSWVPVVEQIPDYGQSETIPRQAMVRFENVGEVQREIEETTVTTALEGQAMRAVQREFSTLAGRLGPALSSAEELPLVVMEPAQAAADRVLSRDPSQYDFLERLLRTSGITDGRYIETILGARP